MVSSLVFFPMVFFLARIRRPALQYLDQGLTRIWSRRFLLVKTVDLGLKWVLMASDELIFRLDGALWLTIILKTRLTPRKP